MLSVNEMITVKNPIVDGWYADPEARKYGDKYYVYVTGSEKKNNLDAFSSSDLVHWEKHVGVIAMEEFPHVHKCVWAPTVIDKNGKYYLIFASNDIHSDSELGGLEIAAADRPEGPFHAVIEGSLVGEFHNGAQPIDAHLFKDDDGTVYLYYGGWRHCNVCRMNDDMTGLVPLDDGEYFREITPDDYVEAPCMIRDHGKYYFMWSSGSWTNGTYHVNYAVSDSPTGGFSGAIPVLEEQLPLANGPGHHGFLYLPEKDQYLIVYHRRIPGDNIPHHRVLCIDRMNLHDGVIDPVVMTESFEL